MESFFQLKPLGKSKAFFQADSVETAESLIKIGNNSFDSKGYDITVNQWKFEDSFLPKAYSSESCHWLAIKGFPFNLWDIDNFTQLCLGWVLLWILMILPLISLSLTCARFW